MRGTFAVDEPRGPRWDLALDLLAKGEAVAAGPVTYRSYGGSLEAAVTSSWLPPYATAATARADLDAGRAQTEQLLASDERFRGIVGQLEVEYVVVADYDTTTVAIARLAGDELIWLGTRGTRCPTPPT